MSRAAAVGALVVIGGFIACAAILGGWLLLAVGAPGGDACGKDLAKDAVPAALIPLFQNAAATYELGSEGPPILAGLTSVESDFGRNMGPSSAGAVGWTQFMPATWRHFGVDAGGDGVRDPMNAADAISSAANYLNHLEAPRDWRAALLGYNHSKAYVDEVLRRARRLQSAAPPQSDCDITTSGPVGGEHRLV